MSLSAPGGKYLLDLIKESLNDKMSQEEKMHLVREELQILILKILFDVGAFRNLAFVGGTALRIIFGLRRFSEDLDFSLIRKKGYSLDKLAKTIPYHLQRYGFDIDIKKNDRRNVQTLMVKFKGVLFNLALSNLKEQKLSIALEIDAFPPEGWNTEISLITKRFIFTVTHYDLPSLYATKLHACFFRSYVKGRDFYDLVWYLGKGILPNFTLLNNAISQTEKRKVMVGRENFKKFLLEELKKVDFAKVKRDVERFLVDKEELKLLNGELIKQAIKF